MLEALELGMSPTSAAKAAGVGRSTAYLWRQEDPEFAAKWDEAVAMGIDRLESEARRRALKGSDKLLMFLLERRRPEVCGRDQRRMSRRELPIARRGRESRHQLPSLEEAMSRMKALGLPRPEIDGDPRNSMPSRARTIIRECVGR